MTNFESDNQNQTLTIEENYQKRLKELDLFYLITTVVNETSSSIPELLQTIANVIPAGWMYSDICEVSVQYGDQCISTPQYQKTQWMLSSSGKTIDGTMIEIDVVYLEHRPFTDEGPFLKEEHKLLQSITDLILNHINSKKEIQEFKKINKETEYLLEKYDYIIKNSPIPFYEVLPDYSIHKINQAFASLTGEKIEKLQVMKFTDFNVLKRSGKTEKDVFESGVAASGEIELRVPAGDKMLLYHYLPVLGPDGTVQSLIAYYIDKTEQVTTIRDIISQIDSAKAGNIGIRINSERFTGEFRQLTEGINTTLDAVIGPLNVAAEYLDRIAKGDIPPRITDVYHGDFNGIKDNLNACIDAVNLLVLDANVLTTAAVKGKLDTRADSTKHQGDFRKIVEGVNETLDSVIAPLNIAAEYVERIAKGDIPPKITDSYNGDFNEIKNNLNTCIDAVSRLIHDTEMLSEAAVNGRLGTRVDVTRHQGDFRHIIEGVNHTLDAVIGPLNVAAGYVDRIAKGDIPPKIVDAYNGDFNEIKNNLNLCIESINALFRDAVFLSEAAIKGKLSTRADSTKHQGDFRKIVEGVNDTLDAVIGPLNVAARYVDRISKGDIPPRISDTYNGDFNEIKNNLNTCIDAVNLLVKDANLLSVAAVKGALDTRADSTKHQGDFRKIVEGVNDTLNAVIGPINDISDILQRMAVNDYSRKISDTYQGNFAKIATDVKMVMNSMNYIARSVVKISEGDLSDLEDYKKYGRRSEQDIIIPAFIQAIETLQRLQEELRRLTLASQEGKLSERGKPEQFKGAYADVITGTNQMLDAILIPIQEGNRVLDQLKGGDLRDKVEIQCKGDHQKMKDAVNGVHTWLSDLITYITLIAHGDMSAEVSKASDHDQIHEPLIMMRENIKSLVGDANLLAEAAVKGELNTRADTTKHQGDFKKIVEGVNDTIERLVGLLDNMPTPCMIIDTDFQVRYMNKAGTELNNTTLNDLLEKNTHCYDHFRTGDCNTDKCACFQAMNTGRNAQSATDAHPGNYNIDISYQAIPLYDKSGEIIGSFEVASDQTEVKKAERLATKISLYQRQETEKLSMALDKLAKGDRTIDLTLTSVDEETAPVQETFSQIYTSLNRCIDAITHLIKDTNLLSDAAIDGKLDIRADATKHQGDFRKIVEGVNGTLDAVIGPLNVAAEYVDRISKGDIPPKITDEYYGDFNEIKKNLNTCIDSVNLLIVDANLLSHAAIDGKLDTRVDATKHQGDFRKIVEGVNGTLDAVISPLNVAAEYVDRISKGDIPQKITDSYNGDFNLIKNNLNTCIDAVNLLVEETNVLTQAAIQGELKTRGDVTRHCGDFRKVIEGMNATLDSIIVPINEVYRVSSEYADSNFSAQFDQNLQMKGDWILFIQTFNRMSRLLTNFVQEITRISASYANGDFTCKIRTDLNIKGDLVLVRDSLNQVSDNISNMLTVIGEEMQNLSKHAKSATEGVDDVNRGANLIAKNAENTRNYAERSSEGIHQVLSAMEDLTRTIADVSINTERVASLSAEANNLSHSGIVAAGRADIGMKSITSTSEQVESIIGDIRDQMRQISKIVVLISDLANQTNLLSLNAAIEAARAGEAGKGFAVVAAEVKSLAKRSRESAEHISEMINVLHKKSEDANFAISEARKAVSDGSVALSDTLSAFTNLNSAVENISSNMEMVASATEEEAASFQEITASVSEMSTLIKSTADDAINSSETSQKSLVVVDQITSVINQINEVGETISQEMNRFKYQTQR